MALHRTLYQVLQVGSVATPDEIEAAHRARQAALASAATPAELAERSLVRDAYEILGDPARRRRYDEQLRERNLRALASGAAAPREAVSRGAAKADVPRGPWWKSYAAIGFAVVAGIVSVALYLDHQRKVEALRIEKERAAAEAAQRAEELRLRERDASVRHGSVDWARNRSDAAYQQSAQRQKELEHERQRRSYKYEEERRAAQEEAAKRRSEQAAQRAEYEQRRREQESVRQSQQQLERDRRYLQELERNRGMKF